MAGISWIASRSLFKTIHRIVLPPLADTPHFAMTVGSDKRWYEVNVPIADRLYDAHLEELKREGLI